MHFERWITKVAALCRGLGWASCLVACDISPDVVSFNTPELCELQRTALVSFTLASDDCGTGCQVCIETTYEDQAQSYAQAPSDCVCPAPERVTLELWDADTPDAASDGGKATSANDAFAKLPSPLAPDGCTSQLNLSQAAAVHYCADTPDCEVCVERVDLDGQARRYMAHECGCPGPYRLD